MTTHLKCRLLFSSFAELWSTQDCWSWLSPGRKAMDLKQVTQTHEGPDHLWTLPELVAFYFKDYLLLRKKSMSWWWLQPEQSETPGTAGDRYFWVGRGHLILCPCPWPAPCCLLLFYTSEPLVSLKLLPTQNGFLGSSTRNSSQEERKGEGHCSCFCLIYREGLSLWTFLDTHCNVVVIAVWLFGSKLDSLLAGRIYINDYED